MTYATDIANQGDLTERVFAAIAKMAESARTRHARRRIYRKTVNELATLSSRNLADLGLSRGDITRVAREASLAAVPR